MTEYIIRPPEKVGSSLDLQPIIVGEIVRCRDCVYMREQPWNAMTATGLWCVDHDIPVNADGYCAWGERKEGE